MSATINSIYSIPSQSAERSPATFNGAPTPEVLAAAQPEVDQLNDLYNQPAHGEPTPESLTDPESPRAQLKELFAAQEVPETLLTPDVPAPEAVRWPEAAEGARHGTAISQRLIRIMRRPALEAYGDERSLI